MQLERPMLIDEGQLSWLAQDAAAGTRRRSHILLHADHQDQVQRLLIGLEPDSYVRPHMHSVQWEMIVLLRGRLDLLIFDDQAQLVQRLALGTASPVAQIPPGIWHSGVALQSQTLVLEVKPGPYRPNEFAEWAPREGEAAAATFVGWTMEARPGKANGSGQLVKPEAGAEVVRANAHSSKVHNDPAPAVSQVDASGTIMQSPIGSSGRGAGP
jgi:cupin fold WbuC family metalloprotein